MAELYSFSNFSFSAVEDKQCLSNKAFWSTEGLDEVNKVQFFGAEDWEDYGGIDTFCSNFGFYPNDSAGEGNLLSTHQQKDQQQLSYLDYGALDNLQFDMVLPPLQPCLRDVMKFDEVPTMFPPSEPVNHNQCYFPLSSLELLNNYGDRFEGLQGERQIQTSDDLTHTDVGRKLSTEDIMRIAGTRFIQSSSKSDGWESLMSHPYDSCFSGLSDEEKEDIELAESLLASAEKVGYQQFERARKLLNLCDSLSSNTGNAVKRVVSYFSEALRERIDRETGRFTSDGKKQSSDPDELTLGPNPATVACQEELPFCQVADFCGVQALLENVTEAKKIHVIDFGIRNGAHWTILMQALESRNECPLELLKVTAVGTNSKESLEETGNRLMNFAHTMNIPFSFKIVMVSDMLDLKESLFELDPEERIAVYSKFSFRSMLPQPGQLESIMKVVRNINTTVMVVTEVEASHNATSFVNRFTEALFYFSALFDCIQNCLKQDDPNRMILESQYFSHGIRNIVAAEGAERRTRHVKIDVWRAFFSRFRMVETELSMSTLYQADLVAKRFVSGSSCTFEMNGNCLLIGWKDSCGCSQCYLERLRSPPQKNLIVDLGAMLGQGTGAYQVLSKLKSWTMFYQLARTCLFPKIIMMELCSLLQAMILQSTLQFFESPSWD